MATNYTPTSNTTAGHLAGIDTALGTLGGGGVSDGDKGDVVVSGSGATWTIDSGVVTLAKMANVATDRLIGRDTAGTGAPEALTVGGGVEFTGSGGIQRSALTGDVTASAGSNSTTIATGAVSTSKLGGDITTAGKALLDDADASAQRTTLGLGGAAVLSVGTTAGTVAAGDDSRIAGAAQKASNLSDLASASTARTNLGLGSLATVADAPSDGNTYGRLNGAWAVAGGGSGLTHPQVMTRAAFRGF